MKIKKDFLGLYTICGGWICRPFYGTIFNEGDEVKTHHFGGSVEAGVTFKNIPECNFTRKGKYERWVTTGATDTEFENKKISDNYKPYFMKTFEEVVKEKTEWYYNHVRTGIPIYEKLNKEFADHFKK